MRRSIFGLGLVGAIGLVLGLGWLVIVGGTVRAAPTMAALLSESFDAPTFPPPGWSTTVLTDTGTFLTPAWLRVSSSTFPTATPHTGAGMAKYTSYEAEAGDAVRLSLPVLDLSAANAPLIEFWVYHSTVFPNENDRIQVQMSLGGGAWSNIGAPIWRVDGTSGWQRHRLPMLAAANQSNVRFALVGIGAFGNNLYVDDLVVQQVDPGLALEPNQIGQCCGGQTITYTLALFNGTTTTDNVTLSQQSGAWPVAILPSSVSIAPLSTQVITAVVSVPLGIEIGERDVAVVRAQATSSGFTAQATLTTYSVARTWQQQVAAPRAARFGGVVALDGFVYHIGGQGPNTSSNAFTETLRYTISTGSWDSRAGLITRTFGIDPVAIADKIYVAGGYTAGSGLSSSNLIRSLQIYTPATNSWTTGAPLPVALAYYQAVVLNERLYVIGGYNGATTVKTMYIYDPVLNNWSTSVPLSQARHFAVAGVINNKIYASGGLTGTTTLNSSVIYDPIAHAWTAGVALPVTRQQAADAVVLDRYLLVSGGYSELPPDGQTYAFDVQTYQWIRLPDMATRRFAFEADSSGNDVYAIGGREYSGTTYGMTSRTERLILCGLPFASPTATSTRTATRTLTPTNTRTAVPNPFTPTASATPSRTINPGTATRTPTGTISTATRTPTGTISTATSTPTGTLTTPTRTGTGNPPTATPRTATPTATVTSQRRIYLPLIQR